MLRKGETKEKKSKVSGMLAVRYEERIQYKGRSSRKLYPATFRLSECDQSAFPRGTWVPGPTAQLSTCHLGFLHGQAETSF